MELTGPDRILISTERSKTSETFRVLGHPDRAQVLVPAEIPTAAGRSLIRYHGGMGFGGRVARRGAALLARIGLMGVVGREKRYVDFGDPDDPQSLRSILSIATGEEEFVVSISLGPPRSNQKPVFRIMRPDGQAVAYAKIGWNSLTSRLVEAEVAALSTERLRGLTTVAAPPVLYSGSWRSTKIAVFGALDAVPGKLTPPNAAFKEVARVWPHDRKELGKTFFAENLAERAETVRGAAGGLAAATVGGLLDRYGDEVFDMAGWHGDWAPWNNARLEDGRIALWDWERAGDQVPEGFDSIHYRFQPAVLRTSKPADQLVDIATVGLEELSRPRRIAIGQLYVASIALRHLQPDSTGGPVERSTQLLRDLESELAA